MNDKKNHVKYRRSEIKKAYIPDQKIVSHISRILQERQKTDLLEHGMCMERIGYTILCSFLLRLS